MRDVTLEDTIYIGFTTRAFATGIPGTLGGTPALSVLEENNATPITGGVSVSVDRGSVTGLNEATIVASAGNGYSAGKGYTVYISAGTVGGVSVVGEVVGQFTIAASAAAVELADGGRLDLLLDQIIDQLAGIAGGLAVRTTMASVTVIQGSEQDLGNAATSDDTRWTGDDDGTGAEFIFRCTPANQDAIPGDLHFEGYYDEPSGASNGATLEVYNFNTATWNAVLFLTNASSDETADLGLVDHHSAPGSGTVETVAHTRGDVLIKFSQDTQETGNACLLIDVITVGFIESAFTVLNSIQADLDIITGAAGAILDGTPDVKLADAVTHGGASAILDLEKIIVTATGNDHAVAVSGSGSGDGLKCIGGVAGFGLEVTGSVHVGGASGIPAVEILASNAGIGGEHGLLIGGGVNSNADGIRAEGAGTGSGIAGLSGIGGGSSGFSGEGGSINTHGMRLSSAGGTGKALDAAEINDILADTADMQPKLGTPAADLAADLAAVKVDTAAVLVDTGTTLQAELDGIQADTEDIQTRLPSALVGGKMDSDAVAISGSTTAADNLELSVNTIEVGAAQTGTFSTTQMTTNLTEATADHYLNRLVFWTSGVLTKQFAKITAYNSSGGLLTFSEVTEAPSDGDTFILV